MEGRLKEKFLVCGWKYRYIARICISIYLRQLRVYMSTCFLFFSCLRTACAYPSACRVTLLAACSLCVYPTCLHPTSLFFARSLLPPRCSLCGFPTFYPSTLPIHRAYLPRLPIPFLSSLVQTRPCVVLPHSDRPCSIPFCLGFMGCGL